MDKMDAFSEGKGMGLLEYIKMVYSTEELTVIYKALNAYSEDLEGFEEEKSYAQTVIDVLNYKIEHKELINIATVSGRSKLHMSTFHNIIYPILLQKLIG